MCFVTGILNTCTLWTIVISLKTSYKMVKYRKVYWWIKVFTLKIMIKYDGFSGISMDENVLNKDYLNWVKNK